MKNIFFIIFILIFSLTVNSEQKAKKNYTAGNSGISGKPSIFAKKWSSNDTTMFYSGNVEIKFGVYQIFADHVEYNKKERIIKAKGRVHLSNNEMSISGEDLVFNLKTKSGTMYENDIIMPPSIRLNTKELLFVDTETTKFKNMSFTSCSQRVPRWSISCKDGRIKKEKYIAMKHAILKIKKIPVFYFPYIRYPIRKGGKATGFLFPKFGTGGNKGFYIQNAFFLNLKSNIDATFYFDNYSKAGTGIGEELRYVFKNMSGNIKYYYFKYIEGNELKPDATSDYYIDVTHYNRFDLFDTNIRVNINTQSDPNFLRLFSNSFQTALVANFKTSFSLNSKISFFKLAINASKRETYYTYRESSRVIKYMPSIKLSMYQKKIWKIPGYFSFKASFERVSRSGVSYEDEPEFTSEFISQRMNVVPAYTLNLLKLPWLSTTVKLSSFQNFYPKSYESGTRIVVPEPLHLSYNTANITIKGPVLYKMFNLSIGKLKHIITPQIIYKYSSQIDDDDLDRLVKVDGVDYPQFSFLSFKLSTRLLFKKSKSKNNKKITPREILRFSISQRYFFDPVLASRGRTIDGIYPTFSELDNKLSFKFLKNANLDLSLVYNYYLKKFQRIGVSLNLTGKDSIIGGRVRFSSYTSPYSTNNYFNRNLINGAIKIKIPGFPVNFNSSVAYDITEKKFRYGSASAKINYQCIKFNLEFKIYSNNLGTYSQFRLGFSLGEMGAVSDIMSGGR